DPAAGGLLCRAGPRLRGRMAGCRPGAPHGAPTMSTRVMLLRRWAVAALVAATALPAHASAQQCSAAVLRDASISPASIAFSTPTVVDFDNQGHRLRLGRHGEHHELALDPALVLVALRQRGHAEPRQLAGGDQAALRPPGRADGR